MNFLTKLATRIEFHKTIEHTNLIRQEASKCLDPLTSVFLSVMIYKDYDRSVYTQEYVSSSLHILDMYIGQLQYLDKTLSNELKETFPKSKNLSKHYKEVMKKIDEFIDSCF